MKKKYQNKTIIILLLLLLLILYTINSPLFIFFIMSTILIEQGLIELLSKKIKLNGSIFYVTIMSILSGIPSGAKYTKDLLDKNIISQKTANYLITYTHFPNPMFVLGTVTTLINYRTAIKVLSVLILSNLIIAYITKPREKENYYFPETTPKDFASSLSKAIGGYICYE